MAKDLVNAQLLPIMIITGESIDLDLEISGFIGLSSLSGIQPELIEAFQCFSTSFMCILGIIIDPSQ